MPPSMQPEMSPMVSTAVTRNMIRMERMAWRLNTGFTGRIRGGAAVMMFASIAVSGIKLLTKHGITNRVVTIVSIAMGLG